MYRAHDERQGESRNCDHPADSWTGSTSIFDVCIERIAGFPATMSKGSNVADNVINEEERGREAKRGLACMMLERRIRILFDLGENKSAHALINLKRDLFNKRTSVARNLSTITWLESDEIALLREVIGHPGAEPTGRALPQMEEEDDAVLQSAEFRAALDFSDLNRARLLRKTRLDGRVVKPGELRRSRLALLQFAARARFKTTPFSYLGSTRAHRTIPRPTVDRTVTTAYVTLDAALARRIAWTLVLSVPVLRRGLEVAINPSLSVDDGVCVWSATRVELTPNADTASQPTTLQAPFSTTLQSIYSQLSEGRSGTIEALEAAGVAATMSIGLLANGFLVPTDMPGAQEAVMPWLLNRVEHAGESLRPLIEPLRTLVHNERSAPVAIAPQDALARLADVRAGVAAIHHWIGSKPPAEQRPPLYHTIKLAPARHGFEQGPIAVAISPHLEAIDALLRMTRVASRTFAAQTATADTFVQAHGLDGAVNGLEFFRALQEERTVASSDSTATLQNLLSRCGSFNADGAIRIEPAEIRHHAASADEHLQKRAVSLGLQAQPTTRNQTAALVLNRSFPGGLRLQARYLDEYDVSGGAVVDYLARIEPNARAVALPATAGVSGALHTQLVHEEMLLPGVERDRRAVTPIRLEDTTVVLDRGSRRVVLLDGAGRRIVPMIFGAVNPELICPLARRLSENAAASPPPIYAAMWLARDVAAIRPERRALLMIPEVLIGNLIITRETMIYPVEDFPSIEETRSFPASIRRFLSERQLPSQLFIRFPDGALLNRLSRKLDAARRDGAARTHVRVKPAYFDFEDDDYAMLFRHSLASGMPLVSIQACSPHPLEADGHVRELQFEALLEANR